MAWETRGRCATRDNRGVMCLPLRGQASCRANFVEHRGQYHQRFEHGRVNAWMGRANWATRLWISEARVHARSLRLVDCGKIFMGWDFNRLETRTKECIAWARHAVYKLHADRETERWDSASLHHCTAERPRAHGWCEVHSMRPERPRTIPVVCEARGNSGGSNYRCWRANRSRQMGIAAKDQSSGLVAGSSRSFP